MPRRLRSLAIQKRVSELQKTLLKIGIVFLHTPFVPHVRQHIRMCGRQFSVVDSQRTDEGMYAFAGLDEHLNYMFTDERGKYTSWVIRPDTGAFHGSGFVKHAMYIKYERH